MSFTLAKISFFIYIFLIFFGTNLPFQDKIQEVDQLTTSSILNQYVFSILFLLAGISLFSKKDMVLRFIRKEIFFSLFLCWTFLSIFWSDYPFVSLKRWIRLVGMATVFLSILLNLRTTDDALPYLKNLFFIYIPLTFISILFIPGAIDPDFFSWRGLAPNKNQLGQISIISLIIWSCSIVFYDVTKKPTAIIFWFLSLILLLGTKSTTSILTALTILFLIIFFHYEKIIARPIIGRTFSLMLVILFGTGIFIILYSAPEIVTAILQFFGKDLTFTGRVTLWTSLFAEAKTHLIFGCGYGGYWVMNSPVLEILFEDFVWLPNQAHMGYLDILNETGLIGLILFAAMVLSFFKNAEKYEQIYFWKWFVIGALIINVTESTIFVLNSTTGIMFAFSYMGLYTELIRNDNSIIKMPDLSNRSPTSHLYAVRSGDLEG